ncbi:uncharacterized protein G2W53_005833 [Senna tora]|uniref:Uncharacterized protein n=1 Tax=Senna tora TaxID=362788 RepID=A0A834X2Z0_9FABA|nr:uncharacterized protein G2W53_005833 [Senna tora]
MIASEAPRLGDMTVLPLGLAMITCVPKGTCKVEHDDDEVQGKHHH